jgi:hypothetical protein
MAMEKEQLKSTTEHPTLADRIGSIERLETELIRKATEIMNVGITISHSTLFVIGALKRTLAQSQGFRTLIGAKNFPCAVAILRMQIDTAMRVNALLLFKEPDACCEAILGGRRFNTLKDSAGNKLTDSYLREKFAEKHPWASQVYKETSDFVHLSGRHSYGSIASTDDDTRVVYCAISGTDPPRPEADYFEVVDAFLEITKVVGVMLLGYFTARRQMS